MNVPVRLPTAHGGREVKVEPQVILGQGIGAGKYLLDGRRRFHRSAGDLEFLSDISIDTGDIFRHTRGVEYNPITHPRLKRKSGRKSYRLIFDRDAAEHGWRVDDVTDDVNVQHFGGPVRAQRGG